MDDSEPVPALPATEAYPAHDNADQSDGRPVSCSDSDVLASICEEEESDSGTDEYYEQGRRWGARRAASKSSMRKRRKRPEWTRSEEETLAQLHCGVGNQWSLIAARLPGRTANEVKNIWHSTLRSKHLKARSLLRAYATTLNGRWDDEAARQEAYNAAVRLHSVDDSQEAPEGTTPPSGRRRSQTSQPCATPKTNGEFDTNVLSTTTPQEQQTTNRNKSTHAASAPQRIARGAASAENLRAAGGRHGGRSGSSRQRLQAARRAAQPEPSDSEARAPVANFGGPTSPPSAGYHAPLPSIGAGGGGMLPLQPGGFLSLPSVATTTVDATRRESRTSALQGRVAIPVGSKRSFEASFGAAPGNSPKQQLSQHFDQPHFQADMPPACPPHDRTWAEFAGYDMHAAPVHHAPLQSEPEPANLLHPDVLKIEPGEPSPLQCSGPEANRVLGLDTWPDRSEPAIMLAEDDNDVRHPGADTGSSTAVRALSMATAPLASAAPVCSGALYIAEQNRQRLMGSSEQSLWNEQGPAIIGAWSSNAQGALFARPQLDLPPSGSQQPYASAPTVSPQHGASSASGSGPMSRLSSYQGQSGPWQPCGTPSVLYSSADGLMPWPHGFFAAGRPVASEALGRPGVHGGWPGAYRQMLFSRPPAMWSPFANGWRPQHLGGHTLGDIYEGNMGPMSAPPPLSSQRPYDCRTLFDQYDKHHSARQGFGCQQATPWCAVQEQHFQQYQEHQPLEQHLGQQRMFRQQPQYSPQVKSFHEQLQGQEQQQEGPQLSQHQGEQDNKHVQEQNLLLEQERPSVSEIFTMGFESLEDPQLLWCISEDTTLTLL